MEEVRAVSFGAETFAGGLDAEGVFFGAEAEAAGNAGVEKVEVFVLELGDFSAIQADEVVVAGSDVEVRVVGGLAIAEVDFLEEAGFVEEGKGAVEGGAGGACASGAEAVEELLGREVFV